MTAHRAARGVTRHDVLEILRRESDMDGLAIISETEIGTELGITARTVSSHACRLEKDGVLEITRHADGPSKNLNSFQLLQDDI